VTFYYLETEDGQQKPKQITLDLTGKMVNVEDVEHPPTANRRRVSVVGRKSLIDIPNQ
jgi:hypothetical protein